MNPDPGLQSERTLLAWRRTSLGLVANGILLVASGHGTSNVRLGLGIVVIVLAFACWAAVSAVYRGLAADHGPRPDRAAAAGSGAARQPAALGSDRLLKLAAGLVLVVGVFDLYAVLTR